MTPASARRTVAITIATALVGTLAAIYPAEISAAARPVVGATTADRQGGSAGDVVLVRHHTRIQLVRNGSFRRGQAHWSATGSAHPRIRIVPRGLHSGAAALVSGTRGGRAVLLERLDRRPTHQGNRYRASAMVRPVGSRAAVTLLLLERNGSRIVGKGVRRVVVRGQRWRRLELRYVARADGSSLIVRLAGDLGTQGGGFLADDVRTVQTLEVTAKPRQPQGGPKSSPTPMPTPTTSSSPTSTPTPTSPSPTPTATTPSPAPSPTGSSSGCTVSALLVPSCGAWWGVYKVPGSGETWTTTYTDLESAVGRKFDIVYRYHDMSNAGNQGQFPDKYETALGTNHILMFSWASRNFSAGTQLQWSDIAAGSYDTSVIDPEAARIKAYGKKVFLTFDPEMDRRMPAAGTAADYVAAYRHIWNRFKADGVTNAVWVWTVTGYSGHDSLFPTLYPGDGYVDWIGYDPYNFASCHNTAWKTFDTTVDGFYRWLETNGHGNKPFMLPEYGTVADPTDPSASGAWYANSPQGIADHPNIKAVLQWDDSAECNSELTVDPGTLAGFAQAGRSPIFNQAPGTP